MKRGEQAEIVGEGRRGELGDARAEGVDRLVRRGVPKIAERGGHAGHAEERAAVPGLGQPVGIEEHPGAGRDSARALDVTRVVPEPQRRPLPRRGQLARFVERQRRRVAGVGPPHAPLSREVGDARGGYVVEGFAGAFDQCDVRPIEQATGIVGEQCRRGERGAYEGRAPRRAIDIGLGPLFGGLLLEWFDWQSVFLLNVPVAALSFALAMPLVPESRDPKPGRFDVPGALLSAGALTALVYGIVEAPDTGWLDPVTLGTFGISAALGVAFVAWERRTPEPMLDLGYFRRPRFGVSALAVGLASFALMGAAFSLTQFLQSAHGYSALEAGAAMTPLALGMLVGAGSGIRLDGRFGTTKVVAVGLVGLALVLLSVLTWTPAMPYLPIGLWFLGLALTLEWVLSPATDAVMGAVPEEKAGVASAMNDLTRQVFSALGVAVIGSLTTSLYADRMDDATAGLPAGTADTARDSVGGAMAVADRLPGDAGPHLADTAANAFTDAMALGLIGAAAVALIGVPLVLRFLPARHQPARVRAVAAPPPRAATDLAA